jgi:hypothetical protein
MNDTDCEMFAEVVRAAKRHLADHPYTDPGDGRSECDLCGKFVYPAIHSCKGVPVTDAAMVRWHARNRLNRPVIGSGEANGYQVL